MTDNNQIQKIIFTTDPVDIIFSILKDNGIQEDSESVYNKFKKGEIAKLSIISQTTKDIASGKILDKNFITLFAKQLVVSEDTTKKILEDIKNKLLPLTKTISANENKPSTGKLPSSFISVTSKTNIEENEKKIEKVPRKIKKLQDEFKKTENINEIPATQEKPKPSGPDTYREPIE